MSTIDPNHLIIFVRAPRSGLVKTRLAAAIGPAAAAKAYSSIVQTVVDGLSPLRSVELRYDPEDAEPELRPWRHHGWLALPQPRGNLGVRMAGAFAEAFDRGAKHVVLIGSDCPDVSVSDVKTAWARLETHDVVLGPAADGGYWLIGLSRVVPALFEGLHWSTDTVLTDTLDRARRQSLRSSLLRELSDVDILADWEAFQRRSGLGTGTASRPENQGFT